jgi:hypothetical protein
MQKAQMTSQIIISLKDIGFTKLEGDQNAV